MGLFDRGDSDACPIDHFSTALNLAFVESAVKSRAPFNITGLVKANIKRWYTWTRTDGTSRIIFLTSSTGDAKIYDASISTVTPIVTFAGSSIDDFQVVSISDRLFFTFHIAGVAATSINVYVYDGTTMREAGSSQPSSFIVAAVSATTGSISSGYHTFGYAWESPSGFITGFANSTASVTFPGNKKADLSSIAVGPSGTVRRHIFASKLFDPTVEYPPEMFFLTTIEDNTTTTKTVDFLDSDLTESADYLLDQLTRIPCGMVIGKYRGRMFVGGESPNKSYLRFSTPNNPESFDSVEGYLVVDRDDGGTVYNAVEYRGQLIIFKDPGVFSTVDDGNNPVDWDVILIDRGIGTGPWGVSSVLGSQGMSQDHLIVGARSGILLFNGVFIAPELSWKISRYYSDNMYWTGFRNIQVVTDPVNKRFFVSYPTLANSGNRIIIHADYSIGLDASNIRFCPWDRASNLFGIGFVPVNGNPVFTLVNVTGDFYQESSGITEVATASFTTGLIGPTDAGSVCHFAAIRLRITGTGSFSLNYSLLDGSPTALATKTLTSAPGKELNTLCNLVSEKIAVTGGMLNVDTTNFTLKKIEIFAKQLWITRYAE